MIKMSQNSKTAATFRISNEKQSNDNVLSTAVDRVHDNCLSLVTTGSDVTFCSTSNQSSFGSNKLLLQTRRSFVSKSNEHCAANFSSSIASKSAQAQLIEHSDQRGLGSILTDRQSKRQFVLIDAQTNGAMFPNCVYVQNLVDNRFLVGKSIFTTTAQSKKQMKKEQKLWTKLYHLQASLTAAPNSYSSALCPQTKAQIKASPGDRSSLELKSGSTLVSNDENRPAAPDTSGPCLPLLGRIQLNGKLHCLLTDLQPCISLRNLMSARHPLPEDQVRPLIGQLCSALAFLHSNRIVHRNLCPEVLALTWSGLLRLIDLQSCYKLPLSFTARLKPNFYSNENATTGKCPADCLSPYTAPEVMLGKSFTMTSDWWSVGAILYEMLTGSPGPFQSKANEGIQIVQMLKSDNCKLAIQELLRKPVQYPKNLSNKASDLIGKFLHTDPTKRFQWSPETGIEEIEQHEFFHDTEWNLKNNYGEIQMQEANDTIWQINNLQVMQMLGDSYGPLLRDRHVVVHKSQMNRCSVVDLLSYRPKASDQAHMLHPQLACLKLVWKPAMRSHRNGWRKVMHERLCWQRISSSVCKDSDTLSYKGLVLPLYAFLETEACYAFITGHIPNSCPLSVLGRLAPLPEPILQVLFAQMALAIHICHKSGILLRCLHRNSFVFDSHCNCVLVDFQSAKVAIRSSSTRLPEHGIEYLAPEQIRSQSYSKSADWFAIGLLLLELIVGSSPLTTYCSQKKIPLNSDQGGNCIIRPPNHVLLASLEQIQPMIDLCQAASPLKLLLKDLLCLDPERRLGSKSNAFHRLQNYEFFHNLNWKRFWKNI